MNEVTESETRSRRKCAIARGMRENGGKGSRGYSAALTEGLFGMRGPGERRPVVRQAGARIDALGLVVERDAALDRADEHAEVAADAFGLVDLELPSAVELGEDRLMRRVLADDVAAAALDAEVLVDPRLGDIIQVQVLPVGDRADRAAAEIVDRRESPCGPCRR